MQHAVPDCRAAQTVNDVNSGGAGLAKGAAPLVVLPEWVRMPSTAAQHWVRYTAMGVLSGWVAIFLYR